MAESQSAPARQQPLRCSNLVWQSTWGRVQARSSEREFAAPSLFGENKIHPTNHTSPPNAPLGVVGLVFVQVARWLDAQPRHFYPVYDYWHTSPEFFLIRLGMLLLILAGSYAWCRWGAGQWGFSPLIQLGQASLLVYWVHIEFVYGRVSILAKRAQTIGGASLGLLIITLAMLALAYIRTHYKGWMKTREDASVRRMPSVANASR